MNGLSIASGILRLTQKIAQYSLIWFLMLASKRLQFPVPLDTLMRLK